MPKISVIIPTYNYGKYIRKAIDSVLIQEGVDTEVIVVDDGSTDNTPQILASYGKQIRLFHQPNKGAPSARNKGIKESKGKYLVFLDADDWFMPFALQSRLNYLLKNPQQGWVYGPWLYHNEAGEDVTERFEKCPFAYRFHRQGDILEFLLLGEHIHTCCVMLKTTLAKEAGGFQLDLPVLQDYEFWLRVAAKSPVGFIKECNIVVVTHAGSISRTKGDNYQTNLRILQGAEKQYSQTVAALGGKWQKRMAYIMAERGRHLAKDGNVQLGRDLLCRAIRRYPWELHHYIGYMKTYL